MRRLFFSCVIVLNLLASAYAENWVSVLGNSRYGISYDSASVKATSAGIEAWVKIKNDNPQQFGSVGMLKSKCLFSRNAEMKTIYTYTYDRKGNILLSGPPADGRDWAPLPPDSPNYLIWQAVMRKAGFAL